MLKKLLNACLILGMIWLAPSAIAAGLAKYAKSDAVVLAQEEVSTVQLVQQPEKSSRIFGGPSTAECISACMPAFGTPFYGPCRLACFAASLKQE